MVTIFAVIPLAVALVLMTIFQRNSRQAGLVTLVLVCAMTGVVSAFHLSPLQLLLALGAGGATALPVLTVLLPALFLYHLQRVTGSMQIVTQHIARLTSDRDLQVLLLVLGLSPFVEALCGFGVGIIVIVPMLLELRLDALRVAVLSLLGQLTTAWGAMGVAVVLTASLTGLPVAQLGSLTALVSLPATIILSLVCLQVSGGNAALRRWWLLALAAAAILTGGACILSRTVGVELMGILSSTLTLAFLTGVATVVSQRAPRVQEVSHRGSAGDTKRDSFWLAVTPYVLLTCFLLPSRLLPPLCDWLQTHMVLAIPAVELRLTLLYLPGFWVSLALLLTIGMRGTPWQVAREALGAAWRQFTPSATSILLFLLTAQVMQASAMMASLGAATAALGKEYVWISPWIAGLGAWLTGSNLGGTVMCSLLQKAAASKTFLSLFWLAAAQNGAGQLARMLSPACLMLAATSVGLKGQEGVLLRKCGPLVLWVMALLTLLLASRLIPSPLVLCMCGVLVLLPCLPGLRPILLALPALESRNGSSSFPRKALQGKGGRTAGAWKEERTGTPGRRSRRVLSELAHAQGWRNLRSLSRATGESMPTVYRQLLLLHARGYVLRSQRRRCFFALAPVQPEAVKERGKKDTENCETSYPFFHPERSPLSFMAEELPLVKKKRSKAVCIKRNK
jgi:lactate permease